ncbi:hypothetical protein Tco_0688498 [Tanacetum coccineum]
MLVRQAYSPTATDTESEPFGVPLETKEPQPLAHISAPPSPDYTPTTPYTDEESEPFEASETRVMSPHFTTPPSYPTSPPSYQQPPPT